MTPKIPPNTRIIDLGYRPRKEFVPYHKRRQRWSCIVAHRRAGKTVACVMDLVDAALRCKKPNPRFAYMAPYYRQAKDVAWSYLKGFALPIPGATINESELRIDLPTGGRVRLYGADNYEAARGLYFDGIVLDEYADWDPRAWTSVIRPALSDREGWATFIGTPKGKNDFYDINERAKREGWFTSVLRASETGIVPQTELDDARSMMTPEQYEQEYECSFDAAIVGAYYGREMSRLQSEKRIRSVPYDPTLEVYTAWDLGLDDATAIWFVQAAGTEIRFIDYYEANNTSLAEIAKVLRNEKPYVYADHYLPHDAEVRELMTAKSRKESLESLGIRPITIAKRQSVEEGINAVRNILPRALFDEVKCERGIECLKQYRREWDDKTKTFKLRPLHDWTSHGADAMRYMATCFAPRVKAQSIPYKSRKYA